MTIEAVIGALTAYVLVLQWCCWSLARDERKHRIALAEANAIRRLRESNIETLKRELALSHSTIESLIRNELTLTRDDNGDLQVKVH